MRRDLLVEILARLLDSDDAVYDKLRVAARGRGAKYSL